MFNDQEIDPYAMLQTYQIKSRFKESSGKSYLSPEKRQKVAIKSSFISFLVDELLMDYVKFVEYTI